MGARPRSRSTSPRKAEQLLRRLEWTVLRRLDGALLGDMGPGDQLQISTSERRVTLLHPPGYDYYRLLRSKLRWAAEVTWPSSRGR